MYAAGEGVVSEDLTPRDAFNEQWMLGLRRAEGFPLASLDPQLYAEVAGDVERLVRQGSLQKSSEGYIKIPSEKLFVSDGIICELMLD
jgi:coproporphyrinogen III oxidase-like Fe-S oxidoreductase